jgi:ATP-binding cassette, subfamily B, multidrug efflux pump
MRLIRLYLGLRRREFATGFALLVVTNLLTIVVPWLLKQAIEALRPEGAGPRRAAALALAIAGAAIVLAVARTASRLQILGASRHVVADLRERLFEKLQSLPASFYARRRTGEIMSRVVNDLMLVRSLFGPGVLNVINVAILYTAGLAMMAIIDPSLALAAVLPYPFLLLGVGHASRAIHQRSNAAQEALADISNRAQENLTGIHQVKAYVREEPEIEAFGRLNEVYRDRNLALARSRGLVVTLMGGLGAASTIIVVWLGGRHVVEGRLSIGGLVAFISYLGILTGPTIMMGWVLGVFQRGMGALRRVEEILSLTSDLPGDANTGPGPDLGGRVTLRGLRFSYPDGPPVLDGIDLEVPPGTTVGIVGRVGSGKSTLVRLLGAVHRVPRGMLFLDGHDLNDLPAGAVRACVAMVPQETFLFSRTIAENIALGRPDAPREAVAEAARIAQLDRDLAAFPEGLDTRVGERGVTLSGGQRQRVALARALLMDPRILVLDDALSSVDADTEDAILRGLGGYTRRRTTLVISHRVSTVLAADRILVLDGGRVAESGTVSDLLARGGLFADLHRRQQVEHEMEAL